MKRSVFSTRPIIFVRAGLATALSLSMGISGARANEFSLVPAGDPIYAQLSGLARPGDAKIPASLTRYEAALQSARALLEIQNRDPKRVSPAQWRAVKALATNLRVELRQMGVDASAAIELAQRNLTAPIVEEAQLLPSQRTGKIAPSGGGLLMAPSLGSAKVRASNLEVPFSQRLRVGSALLAVERAAKDPFADSFSTSTRPEASGRGVTALASENSLSYDLSRWLTVRAASSQRTLSGAGDDSPLFSAPLFAGAGAAKATGGEINVNVGPGLKFSTQVEQLRADTGAAASRIGGGASLSAWQNRLSMSMHLSRVLPEDEAALPATAAQLGVGLDVSRSLSFSLLYQGLFAESKNNNAGRVSGGVNLSF